MGMRFPVAITACCCVWLGLAGSARSDPIGIRYDGEDLIVALELSDYRIQTIEHQGQRYARIDAPGLNGYGEIGEAVLPRYAFRVAIGHDGQPPVIRVLSSRRETLRLADKIVPQQGMSTDRFEMSSSYYSSDGSHPELATTSDPFSIRGTRGVIVTVSPFSYDPSRDLLIVHRDIELLVDLPAGAHVRRASSALYDAYFASLFVNYHASKRSQWKANEGYLILVADRLTDNEDLQRFVAMRSRNYDVESFPLSEAGSSSTEIQSFIKQRYAEKEHAFLLFVGSASDFPYENVGGMASYVRYTLIDDDKTPDIALGLFFVRSDEDLKSLVDKTLWVEENVSNVPNKIVHYSSFYGDAHINREYREIEDYWSQGDWQMVNALAYSDGVSGAKQAAVAALNDGVRFFTYQGHGMQTGWAEGFSGLGKSSHAFVLSFACLTGSFQYRSKSWAETVIGEDGFGVTFLGASENSSIEQKSINRGIARGSTEHGITKIGLLVKFGKEYVYTDPIASSTGWAGDRKYHLFGDPALDIVRSAPAPDPDASDPVDNPSEEESTQEPEGNDGSPVDPSQDNSIDPSTDSSDPQDTSGPGGSSSNTASDSGVADASTGSGATTSEAQQVATGFVGCSNRNRDNNRGYLALLFLALPYLRRLR